MSEPNQGKEFHLESLMRFFKDEQSFEEFANVFTKAHDGDSVLELVNGNKLICYLIPQPMIKRQVARMIADRSPGTDEGSKLVLSSEGSYSIEVAPQLVKQAQDTCLLNALDSTLGRGSAE